MEDMERYGDYTEYEDDRPKSKSKVLFILKILIAVVCASVIAIFAVRMIMFNYYPSSMKTLYFDDVLTDYYYATDGNIKAKTQKMQAPYDDEKSATFMASNLIVIEDAGQLQLCIRINKNNYDELAAKHGIAEEDAVEALSFSLFRNNPNYDKNGPDKNQFIPIGTFSHVEMYPSFMYDFYKLVFNDIDFTDVAWIALAISVNGSEEEPYRIPIYENNSEYKLFTEYKVSKEERPQ